MRSKTSTCGYWRSAADDRWPSGVVIAPTLSLAKLGYLARENMARENMANENMGRENMGREARYAALLSAQDSPMVL